MSKTLLILGDPLTSLKVKGDTSLALVEGALSCGWKAAWAEPSHLVFTQSGVKLSGCTWLEGLDKRSPVIAGAGHRHSEVPPALSSFDLIFVRKDPPVDDTYRNMCLFLNALPNTRAIQNAPSALLALHEKLLPYQMVQEGALETSDVLPSLILSTQEPFATVLSRLKTMGAQFQDWVLKPWLGFAGRGVQRLQGNLEFETAWNELRDASSAQKAGGGAGTLGANALSWHESLWIIQPYLPDIVTKGDRRVLVAQGQILCDIVRYAAPGQLAANLAQGGTARLEDLGAALQEKCTRVAQALQKQGVVFAGLDIIGTRFTEINITSPTGLRSFEDLTQKPLSQLAFQRLAQIS